MKRFQIDILTIFCVLLSLLTQQVNAQIVNGNVTDESGVPLPGANVIIEGTSTGVSSDFDGNFQIRAEQGQVLQFSYIGYLSQKIR
jgi:hypothetical protein